MASASDPFVHIYYKDWETGYTYERQVNGCVIMLGRLVDKSLYGRTYDPEILLTFERIDGTTYQHRMEFDYSYRRVITSIITSIITSV